MARIIRPEERDLVTLTPKEILEPISPGEVIRRQVVSGEDGGPHVQINEISPGYVIHPHSHSEPEVTIVLSGTAHLGDRVCGPGTIVLVDADEEYSIVAGPDEPLTFAVVRPRKAAYQRA